jgi:diguanylate cyclase (GGDEF)-like protein/PAS domain S-box-containing protein
MHEVMDDKPASGSVDPPFGRMHRPHENPYRQIIETTSEGVWVVDSEYRTTFVNPSLTKMLGYEQAEMLGRTFWDFMDEEGRVSAQQQLGGKRAGEIDHYEIRYKRSDGSDIWTRLSTSEVRDDEGNYAGALAMVTDINDRKELEQQLRHQALHDRLTGLPNRALFEDRVTHALAIARRANDAVAVLFVDIDDFKLINDSLGHAAGDDLLRTITQRLHGRLRASDTVACLGGDEFAILVEGVSSADDVEQLAKEILEALEEPYTASDSQMMAPRASIGIAISDGPKSDKDGLLQDADVAMHAAKRQGKGSFAFFEESMHLAAVRRFGLTDELEKALVAEQFELYYQPIVVLETEEISGVEALIRWNHPRNGTLAPGEFIPLAEETGLIGPIGHWVLNEACRQAGSWQTQRRGEPSLYVCVNVSTKQLQDPQLVSDVRAALGAGGLRPDQLVLEITESLLVRNIEQMRERLEELKRLGVRLAVDDFGTGYSTLSYLQCFPFDILKVDKSFVQGLGRGSQQSSIVRTIVELGTSRGLDIVAEGIEQPEQVAELRAMHARLGQGHYFSRPVNASAITAVLTASVPDNPSDLRAPASPVTEVIRR